MCFFSAILNRRFVGNLQHHHPLWENLLTGNEERGGGGIKKNQIRSAKDATKNLSALPRGEGKNSGFFFPVPPPPPSHLPPPTSHPLSTEDPTQDHGKKRVARRVAQHIGKVLVRVKADCIAAMLKKLWKSCQKKKE